MCEACRDKFGVLNDQTAASVASWHCETCGDVKFAKQADQPENQWNEPATNFWDAVSKVAFYAAVVAALWVLFGPKVW